MFRRPVSAIVMKLLAKAAEDRYQTAAGLEHDLLRCFLASCEARSMLSRLVTRRARPAADFLEKLYGREREIETLLACFHRIVNNGAAELVLVSGYSGIGKSSVVNELRKMLVPTAWALRIRQVPTSTSATSPIRPWHKPSRAWSDRCLARASQSWLDGARSFGEALGSERTACDLRLGSGAEAHRRRTTAGPRALPPGRATPLSSGLPALSCGVCPARAPAGAVPRRSAMARPGIAGPAGGFADPAGRAASAVDRGLPG